MADSLVVNTPLSYAPGVYLITHHSSGKLYVGSAASLSRRHGEHQRMLRRGNHENAHLQRAWSKYGPDGFVFTVLLYCGPADLLFYEQRALDHFRVRVGWRNLYNSNYSASSRLGSRHSPETKAKLSAKLIGNTRTLGRQLSPQHKQKIAIATRRRNLGSTLSEITKAKIGNANRGKIPTEETRAKISAALRGREFSDHHRRNLADSPRFRGRHHSEEAIARISRALKGRTFSEETRKKISEGVRAWRSRTQINTRDV